MEQGQTLIGVIIAAATMTLLVLGITSLAVVTTRLLADSERHTVALGIVNERIEFIRSLPYDDVGFIGGVIPGVLGVPSGSVTYNGQDYYQTMTIGYEDDPLTSETEDYKKVFVNVQWDTPAGHRREVGAVTYVTDEIKPLGCAICPDGRTCDATIGFCLLDIVVSAAPTGTDCEAGLLCPDGSLCPVSGVCPGGVDPGFLSTPSGPVCTPGHLCSNGALCSLSGVCPTATCSRGECQGSDVCFSGFCYPPDWYEFTFPGDDGSGPGFIPAMMCRDESAGGVDLCATSADCPATCVNVDGIHLAWQCERTWVPDCRDGNAGGASAACRGGYDSGGNCNDLECLPVACPDAGGTGRSYCANGEECYLTSTNRSCTAYGDLDCPPGEMCNGSVCRTICPDKVECRSFWGGYTKGCKVYAIDGAVAGSAPVCPVGGVLPPVSMDISHPGSDQSVPFDQIEGNSGTTAVDFTVTLSRNINDTVTVQVVFQNGLAVLGSDYQASSTALVFNPGGPLSQTVTVQVIGDRAAEGDEDFSAVILDAFSNVHSMQGVGSSSRVIIINDDPIVSITNAASVPEGDLPRENQAVFDVTRTGATVPPQVVTVTVTTRNGTAEVVDGLAGEDYYATTQTITFSASSLPTDSQSFLVDIFGDTAYEGNESFSAEITSASVSIGQRVGSVMIVDDDDIVDIQGAPSVTESDGLAVFTVMLRGGPTDHDVIVTLSTQDDTAVAGSDYVARTGDTVTIPQGSSSATFSVSIVDDSILEPATEMFSVTIDAAVGADVGSTPATGTITDNDIRAFDDPFTESVNTILSSHIPNNIGLGWTRIIEVGWGNNRLWVQNNGDYLQRGTCGGNDGVLYQTDDVMSNADYDVSVLQINGDVWDDYNVLAARVQDANNMYALKWNRQNFIRRPGIYKRVGGVWTRLAVLFGGVGNGSTVTLRVQGSNISMLVNGNPRISVSDNSLSAAGRVGIGLGAVIDHWDDCSAQRLDDFWVTYL